MKRVSVFLLILILTMEVCGCMHKRSQEEIMASMVSSVSEKYGKEFPVEYFRAAKDYTYSNILTLSYDGCLFNVYQRGDEETVSDDLVQAVASKKTAAYLLDKLGGLPSGFDLYGNFLYSDLCACTLEEIEALDVSKLLAEKQLVKAIAVLKSSEPLESCKETSFAVYQALLSLDPRYIDLELIYVPAEDAALEQMLNNLPGCYDSAWNKQKAVKDFIAISDQTLSSPDELLRR